MNTSGVTVEAWKMGKPIKVLVIGLPRAGKTTYLAAFWHLLLSEEVADALQMSDLQPFREHLNNITALWRQWKKIARTTLPKERVVTINLRIPGSADDYELAVPDASGEAFSRIFETRRCSADFEALASEAEAVMLFIHPSQAIPPQTIDVKVDALADLIDAAFDDHGATDVPENGTAAAEPSKQDEAAQPEPLKFSPKYATYQSKLVDLLQISRSFRGTRPQKLAVVISAWDLCAVEGFTPEEWLKERLPLLHQYLNSNDDVCSFEIYGISAQGAELKTPGALVDVIRASDRIKVVHKGQESKDLTLPIRYVLSKSGASDE
jgi:GTPase SAR1 family protein